MTKSELKSSYLEYEYLTFRGLWRRVIYQAILDLKSLSKKEMAKVNRIKSVLWFNLSREDFQLICYYADLDPFFVWEKSQKIKKNNTLIPL